MNISLNIAQVISAVAAMALNTGSAVATPDYAYLEALGAQCESGIARSCRELVNRTQGQCAGPQGSGCRYDSAVYVDNGLMVNVPGHGASRVETVTFCLNQVGVDRYQDLITDTDFDSFGICLQEHT